MMSEKDDNEFTVQGRDTPVPVEGVERPGPPRPSASDWSAPMVGDQAGVQGNATGIRSLDLTQEEEVFKRRTSIIRSPTRRGSSSSLPDMFLRVEREGYKEAVHENPAKRKGENSSEEDSSFLEDKEFQMAKKRKEEPDEEERLVRDIRQLIKSVGSSAKEMQSIVTKIPNTKIEIKRIIGDLERRIETLDRKSQKYFGLVKKSKSPCTQEKKVMVSVAIQADVSENKRESEKVSTRIRESISKGNNFADIAAELDKVWPESAFHRVKVEEMGLGVVISLTEEDLAAVVNPRDREDQSFGGQLAATCQPLRELLEEGLIPGQLEYVASTTKVMSSRKADFGEVEKFTYLLPWNVEDGDFAENLYKMAEKCADETAKRGRRKLGFIMPDEIDRVRARKVLETIKIHKDMEVRLYIPPGSGNSKGKMSRKNLPSKKKFETSAVIVKGGNRKYAEVLASLKNSVKVDEIGVEINKVKKTAKGDLLILIEGGSEKRDILKMLYSRA